MYDETNARPIRAGGQDIWFSNLDALERRIQAEIANLDVLERRLESNPRDREALELIADRAEFLRELLEGQKAWIDELGAVHDSEIDGIRRIIRQIRGENL